MECHGVFVGRSPWNPSFSSGAQQSGALRGVAERPFRCGSAERRSPGSNGAEQGAATAQGEPMQRAGLTWPPSFSEPVTAPLKLRASPVLPGDGRPPKHHRPLRFFRGGLAAAVALAEPHPGVCGAGRFRMGSPEGEAERREREGPVHEVRLGEFLMGQTPITQAQWRAAAEWQDRAGERWGRKLKPFPSWFCDAFNSERWHHRGRSRIPSTTVGSGQRNRFAYFLHG